MKRTKKKITKGASVRLTEEHYETIKEYCKKNGYKIGAFVERAALSRILPELTHAST